MANKLRKPEPYVRFPTNEQVVWLIGEHVSGMSGPQLADAFRKMLSQLMIRKGVGRIYLVDSNGNEVTP